MKICSGCNKEKSDDCFYTGIQCKECLSKKQKEYRKNNKNEISKRRKNYRKNNVEKIKESKKKCYENKKEEYI